jgi:hypothetical protein
MNLLELHPATALWWAQREQCRACAHYTRNKAHADQRHEGYTGERCTARRADQGLREFLYCIDARLPGAFCGPDAAMFKRQG